MKSLRSSLEVVMSSKMCFLFILVIIDLPKMYASYETEDGNINLNSRQGKYLPFIIPPYQFAPQVIRGSCIGNNDQRGSCLTLSQCISIQKGTPSGSCSNNKGVCCVFIRQCGASLKARVSYFTNPNYPKTDGGGTRCQITINKADANVCQLRLDFFDLSLAPPKYDGTCVNDILSLGDPDPNVPTLCGSLTGQHVYLDFGVNCDNQKITIDTSSNVAFGRRWNIKIQQISCNSTQRAPRGCLQYYTDTSGTVTSFNWSPLAPPSPPMPTDSNTNMIVPLNYGICVRPELGYCQIVWSQSDSSMYSFTVSGDSTDRTGVRGAQCRHSFVVIANPTISNVPPGSKFVDRFCGGEFPTVTSSSKPFVLYVVTSSMPNMIDINNRGFKLDYRQLACKAG